MLTEIYATLDKHVASAKSDNIEITCTIPHELAVEEFLLHMRHNKHYLRMTDFDRGNGKTKEWPEILGSIKGPKFPDKNDSPGSFVFVTEYNMAVLKALDWIRKCDPRQIRFVDSQMMIPSDDDDEQEDDPQTEISTEPDEGSEPEEEEEETE